MLKEQLRQSRVLVVGDVMLDRYWFGDVERISPEAPVPVVRIQDIDERLGGAANVARNITALGASSVLMGVVGDDEAGLRVHELIAACGIGDQVFDDTQARTTVKLRVIGRQQQLLRADFESLPDHEVLIEKLDQFKALLPGVKAVVLSDYGKGGLLHIEEMIAAASSQNVMTLVDPKGDDYARYTGATLLTPNRSEFAQVVGRWKTEAEMTEKAHRLRHELRLGHLLVTRSEDGMSLYTLRDGQPAEVHVAARAREVFDVSGAGDTVIATLAVLLAAGEPVVRAMELANRAGGIVVGKLGTATVTAEELFAEGP
ncbi:MAG: D-glycero-beta-D-manno-heptose-7-phosphate kinase [Burkholderiaceae bacterium]|nr:D-glycero-beta-D-manno-heptose-7-phosphate kinase [Burkholderiaceae bacterium]